MNFIYNLEKYLGILLFGNNFKEQIHTNLSYNERNIDRVLGTSISEFIKDKRFEFRSINSDLYIIWGQTNIVIIIEPIRIFGISSFLIEYLGLNFYSAIFFNVTWNVWRYVIQYKNKQSIRYLLRSIHRGFEDDIILIKVRLTSFINDLNDSEDKLKVLKKIEANISLLIEIYSDYNTPFDNESWQEVLVLIRDSSKNNSNQIEKIIHIINEENLLGIFYDLSYYDKVSFKFKKIIEGI